MPDPRIQKLAEVLVHYSLEIKPGQQFVLRTNPIAEELALAVYQEAVRAGAHVFPLIALPGTEEIFFRNAANEQLDFISPIRKLIVETMDAQLVIGAEYNTRSLTGIEPSRLARVHKASAPLTKTYMERSARNEFRWCYTEFRTQASAQEADMSLLDYQEFVYHAGLLTEACLLANIALRVDRKLLWDGPNLKFTNSEEANKLLHREYRSGWEL